MTPRSEWKAPSRTFDIDLWPGKPVTDQKRSGRCWLYASLDPLRQRMCERYDLEDFRFSTNYLYFFDQLQKSEDFLDRMTELRKRPFHDTAVAELLREPTSSVGQWCYFAVLAEEHGLVPLSAMPDTAASVDGTELTFLLCNRLRKGAVELRNCETADIPAVRAACLADIRAILTRELGMLPEEFDWNGETITPVDFLREIVGERFGDRVMLMHHPSERWPSPRAYHEIEDPAKRHPYLTTLSVEMETIKAAALRQLRDGEQVVIGCDPRWQSSRSQGVLDMELYDWDGLKLPKAEAIEAKQINACHVMSIDGWAADGRWKVQDSHGLETGPDGHYVMTDGWFDAFVLSAVIRKKYLLSELLALLEHPVYMPKDERF